MASDAQREFWPGRRKPKPRSAGSPNWFVPYLRVYAARYRCHLPDVLVPRVARVLRSLDRQYGTVALKAFERYCAETGGERFNIWRFADGFPSWAGQVPPPVPDWRRDRFQQRPGETLDQYAARLAAQ